MVISSKGDVMTNGYATTATDNALQANIIAARARTDDNGERRQLVLQFCVLPARRFCLFFADCDAGSSTTAEIAYSEANIPGLLSDGKL